MTMPGEPSMDEHPFEGQQIDTFEVPVRRFQTSIHEEQMRQARWSFNFAMALGGLGTAMVLAGVAAILMESSSGWAISTSRAVPVSGLGAILNAISAILIRLHRAANSRLDEIRRDEQILRMIGEIADQEKRDSAILEAVKNCRSGGGRRFPPATTQGVSRR